MQTTKSIKLLLNEDNLDGVIVVQDSEWQTGELYSAPREKVDELLRNEDAIKNAGVYLLLSKEYVYVGQSLNLSRRISQHKKHKDWWQSVTILTTIDDRFNRTHIDYIESQFINLANRLGKLDVENKNKRNTIKVDKFNKPELDKYIKEALFLLDLIGIKVFNEKINDNKKISVDINLEEKYELLSLGKGLKKEALSFLTNRRGLTFDKNTSYATLQKGKKYFWINPKYHLLNENWKIVLNNTIEHKLIIMNIPKSSLRLKDANNILGLITRKDANHKDEIDLEIDASNYTDRRSKVSFSKFIIDEISY